MGKKRSAARRAAATATAAPAPATTPSLAVPLDTHAAIIDTLPAPTVRDSPTNMQASAR
ncbi:hypothetical protein EWM64_g9982 [Hericium alpestre]|uniref:Uncharacterized protein n=1 Tax=Hericium alpestre TaxID=135208 RepID=A0A4Y9ZIP1_9AGAM|nr:hypothetical protein EWM64_g9982 [Hericium alpestre]